MATADAAVDPAASTPAQVAAALWLGSLGLLILGIQPVVLEPLVRFGRLDEASLGSVATVEILALAIGSVLGARLLRPWRASVVAFVALLPFATSNLAMHWVSSLAPLLAARALAGLAGGVLVGLAIVTIARAQRPERLAAAFLVLQTVLQLGLAALVPGLAQRFLPEDVGFVTLALLGAASLPVVLSLPRRLAPPRAGTNAPAPVAAAAWVVLLGCAAYLFAIVAVWAYFGIWAHQVGLTDQAIGTAVALSLGAQVLGAATAGWLGPRLRSLPTLLLAGALQTGVVLGLLHWSTLAAQLALALAFGFLWLFALPLQTRLLIEVDPTRRAVLHLAAAQLTGSAAGPSVASLFVTTGRVDGALWTGVAAMFIATLLIVLGGRAGHRSIA